MSESIKDKDDILAEDAEVIEAQHPPNPKDEESQPPAEQERHQYSKARLIALVLTVAGASIINTLGVQATVIILPTIGKALDIPGSRQQWIVSAYSLTFACFLLLWGRIADVYGKRLVFIWGSVWLAVTFLVTPFITNEIGFDVIRGLQGLGAAANVPTAIGILGVTFPPGKAKNYAFACYGAGAPMGSVFGNLMGGVIGEYLTWKWVFWIIAILAGIVAIVGHFVIPVPPVKTEHQVAAMKNSVDWIGGTIVTIGLLMLLFALTEGNVVGWNVAWVPVLIALSLVIVAIFVLWQWYLETKTTRRPLMKVSIFHNRRFSSALVVMLLFFACFNNYLIFATYFFQDYLGLSVIQTTIRFIPTGVCGTIIAFITGYMLSRVRGDFLLAFGTLCVSISCLLFAIPISPHTTYFAYGFPAMVLSVCGADTLFSTLLLLTAHSLPQGDQALGAAIINAVGQVGRAIGLAIATALETALTAREKGVTVKDVGANNAGVGPGDPALLHALRNTEWLNFAFGIAACVISVVFLRGVGRIGKH